MAIVPPAMHVSLSDGCAQHAVSWLACHGMIHLRSAAAARSTNRVQDAEVSSIEQERSHLTGRSVTHVPLTFESQSLVKIAVRHQED